MSVPKTLLSPENTICKLQINSKKSLIEYIAKLVQKELSDESWEDIFDALIAREKVGTTGFGNGIAIPHCRLSSCTQAIGFFTRLEPGIDFDALDKKEVDLVFTLIVPLEACNEHLEILSSLAEILANNALRVSLRDADSNIDLFKRMNKMLEKTL